MIKIVGAESQRAEILKNQLWELGVPHEPAFTVMLDSLPLHYDSDRCIAHLGRLLGPREVGCALSHWLSHVDLVQSGRVWDLVLEDDARIDDPLGFIAFLAEAESLLATETPMVVSLFSENVVLRARRQKRAYRCWTTPSATVAYAINRAAAAALVEANQSLCFTADWPQGTQITFWLWLPMPISHDENALMSTIGIRGPQQLAGPGSCGVEKLRHVHEAVLVYSLIRYFTRDRQYFVGLHDYWRKVLRNRIRWHVGRMIGCRTRKHEFQHHFVPRWIEVLIGD